MDFLIMMIGKDGSVMTSKEEKTINYGKNSKHDFYFQKDIYPSEWFAQQNIPYHPEKKMVWQLTEMVSTGTIIMLDTSKVDKKGNLNLSIQIVTPDKKEITQEQKEILTECYTNLKSKELQYAIIDCVKDANTMDIESYDDIDSFYEALGIKQTETLGRHI